MVFLASSVAGYFIPSILKHLFITVSAVALVTFLILIFFKQMSALNQNLSLIFILVSLMVMLSMLSSLIYFDSNEKRFIKYYNTEHIIDAVVLSEIYENDYYSKYNIEVKYIDGERFDHKATFTCEYNAVLDAGDKISAIVTAAAPKNSGGRFNERTSMLSDGMFICYTSYNYDGLEITERSYYSARLSFSLINSKLSELIMTGIGGDEGKLTSALFLGNKQLISDEVSHNFARTGASHILALSGMHMTVIMGAVMYLIKRITQNFTLISVIMSLLAVFYLGLTGFSVSATRSVIMLIIVYCSLAVRDDPDPLTSLSVAGFLIVLFSPGAILDAGFWMSFTATLGILTYVPAISNSMGEWIANATDKRPVVHFLRKIVSKLVIVVTTSLSALIPLVAVMCIFIKEISFFSIISSLVLSLPASVVLLLSLFYLPLLQIPYVSSFIGAIIRISANFMIEFCEKYSDTEGIVVSLNYPFAAVMAVILGIAILYSLIAKHKRPFTSLIPFAMCLVLCVSVIGLYEYANRNNVKVSYIKAASNSDMIVLSNERAAVICDMSNGSKSSYSLALDEIYDARSTEIKAIILTRHSSRHNTTLFDIFMSEKVREIWIPHPENSDEYYRMERLLLFASDAGVDVYTYNCGESIEVLDDINICHKKSYIERSKVPISYLRIYTREEQAVYLSPAFNECELAEEIQLELSDSNYVIFGSRGPRTKKIYTIDDPRRIRAIIFADDIRAAYLTHTKLYFHGHYIAHDEFEFYMDKY